MFSGLLEFFGPPSGAQGPPKNHFGVQKGRANIEGEQFFLQLCISGPFLTIWTLLGPILEPPGSNFGPPGNDFWRFVMLTNRWFHHVDKTGGT